MGSVIKKRRKKMAKHKHRKFLKKTREQRLRGNKVLTTKNKKKTQRNREKGLF